VLLINGIIALIGILTAFVVVQMKLAFALTGFPLVILCFFGLWFYLFLSDVAEDWLITKFNKDPA